MTREEFEKIEAEKGFNEALSEFANCDEYIDEIKAEYELVDYAIECLKQWEYATAESICSDLNHKTCFTGWWRYDYCGEAEPIDNIEDIEDLFE